MSVNGTCTVIDLVTAARTKEWGDGVRGCLCGEEGQGRLFHDPSLTDLVPDKPN